MTSQQISRLMESGWTRDRFGLYWRSPATGQISDGPEALRIIDLAEATERAKAQVPFLKSTGPTSQTMETCEISLAERLARLMSLRRGCLASLRAAPGKGVAVQTCAGSGPRQSESLATYDPPSRSLRTRQGCLLSKPGEPSTELLVRFPRSAMICGGKLFPLVPLVRITRGIGSSLLPTLTSFDARAGTLIGKEYEGTKHAQKLMQAIHVTKNGSVRRQNANGTTSNLGLAATASIMHPTMTAGSSHNRGRMDEWGDAHAREKLRVIYGTPGITGALNPTWCEWFMGFPSEWTFLNSSECPAYDALGTVLSRKSPKSSPAQSNPISKPKDANQ